MCRATAEKSFVPYAEVQFVDATLVGVSIKCTGFSQGPWQKVNVDSAFTQKCRFLHSSEFSLPFRLQNVDVLVVYFCTADSIFHSRS